MITIEVNTPKASVTVIENMKRFILSLLHQFFRHLGRGAEQSFCILVSSVTARELAMRILENDPRLEKEHHQTLKTYLAKYMKGIKGWSRIS